MKPLQLDAIYNEIEAALPELRKQYHIKSIGLFGSFVKNKQKQDSDLDILISFTEIPGLFTFIELENKLSDLVGIKVDLVMEDALKPKIAERILNEVIRLS